jgi:hypothetical protein
MNGTEDLLGHLDCVGFGGGYRFAILVGNGGNDSSWYLELVDCVS